MYPSVLTPGRHHPAHRGGSQLHGEATLVNQSVDVRSLDALMAELRHHLGTGYHGDLRGLLAQVPIPRLNKPIGSNGRTLLHEAALHAPEPEIALRALLDAGAHPSLPDAEGRDALMLLVRRTDEPLGAATLLLRRGAGASRLDHSGMGVLHTVLNRWRHGLTTLVPMLLRRQADLDRPNPRGVLPLYLAAGREDGFALCRAMLAHVVAEDRGALACALSGNEASPLGTAGTAALLHGTNEDEVVRILALLADYGMALQDAEALACSIHDTGRAQRSFQDTHRCVQRARALRQGVPQHPYEAQAQVQQPLLEPPRPPSRPAIQSAPEAPPPTLYPNAPPRAAYSSPPTPLRNVNGPHTTPEIKTLDLHRNVAHTRSLHDVARNGPPGLLREIIADDPERLRIRDHIAQGGHLPVALAVLGEDPKNVATILEALRQHQMLDAASLDTPSNNGMCAFSLAIEANAQRSAVLLLEAGASPLLPIPQPAHDFRRVLWRKVGRSDSAPHAAAYCVTKNRPFFLGRLLAWDEERARERAGRPYAFDVSALQLLARPVKNSLALRGVLEDAAHRRRAATHR